MPQGPKIEVLDRLTKRELKSCAIWHMQQIMQLKDNLTDDLGYFDEDELEDLVMILGDIEFEARRAAEYVYALQRREEGK